MILREVAKSNQSREKNGFPRHSSEKETFRSLDQKVVNLFQSSALENDSKNWSFMKCLWNWKPPQLDELLLIFHREILRNRTKEKTVQEKMADLVPLMFFTYHPPAYEEAEHKREKNQQFFLHHFSHT